MARSPKTKNPSATPRARRAPPRPRLPDPKIANGPRRPFTDPGWDEAWWWLGIPVAVAAFVLVTYQIDADWYRRWMVSEGLGFLELSQFLLMVGGFVIAVRLLSNPFVRERPLVLAVTVLGALFLYRGRGDELGPASVPLEHAGVLGRGKPPERD
ncbi:MAG: hypothetical protein R3D01_11090 [Hyphomicrobiales bacterium]